MIKLNPKSMPTKYGEPSVITGHVLSGAHTGVFYIDDVLGCCYGKLTSTDDLVTFESDSLEGIEVAFVEAVEDYERTKRELGA